MADDLAVAARFTYRHEAEFALETLREAGIQAALLADDVGGAYPGLSLSGPVRILVRADELERARAALGEGEGG